MHNLTEARWLLAGERPPAYRVRLRRSLEKLVATVIEVAGAAAALHPRILRLFDDADEPTPRMPVASGLK